MEGNVEDRIRLLISVRLKLQAQLIFCKISCNDKPKNAALLTETYPARIRRLLDGIDGLLLLVTEEVRYILELHLVEGMKWETVMEEYGKRWTSEMSRVERTYKYRQQGALRKMSGYLECYAGILDFSWLYDPIIDELAATNRNC
jgi:hypothetical protein